MYATIFCHTILTFHQTESSRCKGGLLLWPSECCVVDFAKGIAMIYACQQRYMRWISDEEQRWSPSTVFAGFKGKQREFFYKSEENPEVILYAGTFEASRDTCVFDPMGYRNLPNNVCVSS